MKLYRRGDPIPYGHNEPREPTPYYEVSESEMVGILEGMGAKRVKSRDYGRWHRVVVGEQGIEPGTWLVLRLPDDVTSSEDET